MTISAADHDDPTKATITDVATLIASGAGAGLSPAAHLKKPENGAGAAAAPQPAGRPRTARGRP